MSDLFTLILGIAGIFVVLSGAAYFLQPSAMKKNGFFTTPPILSVKIVAFLIGLIFLLFYVLEFLTSPVVHLIPPIMAAVLFLYAFAAERLIRVWENRKKK